jgi:hypothetical protein
MARIHGPEVKVGQVWRLWDSRLRDSPDWSERAAPFLVMQVEQHYALVQRIFKKTGASWTRRIHLDRFRANSNGYKLLFNVFDVAKAKLENDGLRELHTIRPVGPFVLGPPLRELEPTRCCPKCHNPQYVAKHLDGSFFCNWCQEYLPLADDEVLIIEVSR